MRTDVQELSRGIAGGEARPPGGVEPPPVAWHLLRFLVVLVFWTLSQVWFGGREWPDQAELVIYTVYGAAAWTITR